MFNLNNLKNDWCSFRKIVIHLRYPRVFGPYINAERSGPKPLG